MAPLARIASHLRTVLAPHVALKLVDRRRLRSPHDVQGDGLVGVATGTADFEIIVPRIERIPQRRRRLRRSLRPGQPVSLLAGLARSLSRRTDGRAVDGLA